MERVRVGITIGDFNGIGPEVIIKAFSNETLLKQCQPIIYGSSKILAYHKNIIKSSGFSFSVIKEPGQADTRRINVINCWKEDVQIQLGAVSVQAGRCAHMAIDRAIEDAKAGKIDAIVTAPIHKKSMQEAGFPFAGHTEYFAQAFSGKPLMLMVHQDLRVALTTMHIPLSAVANTITKELVKEKLNLLIKCLTKDYQIEKPNVAILGLNPHAGDDGLIGEEENKIIRPLIIEYRKSGLLVAGPYAADGFFGAGLHRKFDGILAMYHDQGLTPFKALSFGSGVNVTAGLSFVRCSPDHGTGFDIAGKNRADPNSFRAALYQAIDIFRNRQQHTKMNENPLKKQEYATDKEHSTA